MKHGQNNRRQRTRGNGRKYPNQKGGSYDSNGPEAKVRGNASQVLEKYQALARDANSAGDRILAEGYLQHAEHYYRILNAESENSKREDNNRGRQERDKRELDSAGDSAEENRNDNQQQSSSDDGGHNNDSAREKNPRRRASQKENKADVDSVEKTENPGEGSAAEAAKTGVPVEANEVASSEDEGVKKPRTRRPRKPQPAVVSDDASDIPQAAD